MRERRFTLYDHCLKQLGIEALFTVLCDDRLGSITVGKEADLVVLGTDITACSPEHIQDAPVFGTMVGGEWVYTCK